MAIFTDDTEGTQGITTTQQLFRKLDEAGYKFQQHIYPEDLGNDSSGLGHYIIFNINESVGSSIGNKQQTNNESNKILNVDDIPDSPVRQDDPRNLNNKNLTFSKGTRRIKDSIILYMPENITTAYGLNYEQGEIGASVAAAAEAVSDADLAKGFDGEVIKKIGKRVFTDTAKNLGDIITKVALGAFSDSVKNTLQAKTRLLRNPHLEFLFRGVDQRVFNFEFKFVPKSHDEAVIIRNIIKRFKLHALPEVVQNGSEAQSSGLLGVFYRYPSEFDITFFANGKRNRYLNRISTCALQNIEISYSGAGTNAFMRDADGLGTPPAEISLTLTFMELELMSRNRIEQGF